MPKVIPNGSKVLVTGANGYIAAWVVRTLLEKGYAVRDWNEQSIEEVKQIGKNANKLNK
ncbi:hypothetical protein J3R30DRAFT_3514321 [Lentinula aciculospora]|uniref:NAD-dependent epimerase/dehydratase domain-containing protein n=1 Tax=Lentinula aciculospora TaxID=153920 RepID=A0A9W9DJ82_9AGAR|nr:hypothetical protein J3R30DRAFT_3514321 [Lentinula aciculospora]